MPSSNLKRLIAGFGAVGTILLYPNENNNSWITPPLRNKWDHNWDRRHSEWTGMKINEESDKHRQTLVKKSNDVKYNIILVRHGQYNTEGETDLDRTLTALGRQQAEATGQRLQELGLPYNLMVQSSITRAKETAQIIKKYLKDVTVTEDSGLTEGIPILPDPPINFWKSDLNFHEDGPRIEAAFKKYFHRPDPNQEKDSYVILVCHANVIRYFVCRALQFPPEGWLRLSLNHASITWIYIRPNGRVTLKNMGNSGHLKPHLISSL